MASSIQKEFHTLLKNLRSFTEDQVKVVHWDPDEELSEFQIEIRPNAGPYRDGVYLFKIKIPENYPSQYPDVICKTNIYHPNIDPMCDTDYTNICLNLFDEWQETFGLETCVQGLLFLMHNPNSEDPLSPYFSGALSEDELEENLQRIREGLDVDDIMFDHGYAVKKDDIETGSVNDSTPDLKRDDIEAGNVNDSTPDLKRDDIEAGNVNDSTPDLKRVDVEAGNVNDSTPDVIDVSTHDVNASDAIPTVPTFHDDKDKVGADVHADSICDIDANDVSVSNAETRDTEASNVNDTDSTPEVQDGTAGDTVIITVNGSGDKAETSNDNSFNDNLEVDAKMCTTVNSNMNIIDNDDNVKTKNVDTAFEDICDHDVIANDVSRVTDMGGIKHCDGVNLGPKDCDISALEINSGATVSNNAKTASHAGIACDVKNSFTGITCNFCDRCYNDNMSTSVQVGRGCCVVKLFQWLGMMRRQILQLCTKLKLNK